MDAVAFVKGGRAEVPANVLWAAVAGVLLPVLNVYFVARDLIAGRRKDAALGVILSVVALIVAFDPPWSQFMGHGSNNHQSDGGCQVPPNEGMQTSAASL